MTEYLILSLNRAVPLVWEYNREITFDLTFNRTYGNIPKSMFARIGIGGGTGPSFTLNSTSYRIFRAFGTPPAPSAVNGIKAVGRPRLHKIVFTLFGHVGAPQFRIDLHYANSDGTPGSRITSFTPSVYDHGSGTKSYYVDLGDPPSAFTSGLELQWNTLYSIVLVPTVANSSNYARADSRGGGGDTLVMKRIGYSTNSGSTWTISDGYEWGSHLFSNTAVAYAFYYESSDVTVPIAKSSEAFRSYFNGWVSRTLPSGFNLWRDYINGVSNLSVGVEVPVSDAYTHSVRFYTTADVTGFTQADVASFKWKYNINPVTIDMFYASEAYLQQIDFLNSGTNSVRLNDSYEQEFSGSGGTSVTFNPPILWWKAQVTSGRVSLKALVFE